MTSTLTRSRHPAAYAIVRPAEATDDDQLEAVPSRLWLRTIREVAVVAVAIDSGAGRTVEEIRASLVVTILDPGWRRQIDVCLERHVMGEAMAAEDGLDEDDRRIAALISDLPEIEPPEGWEDRVDRAVERARAQERAVEHAVTTLDDVLALIDRAADRLGVGDRDREALVRHLGRGVLASPELLRTAVTTAWPFLADQLLLAAREYEEEESRRAALLEAADPSEEP